MNGERVRLYFQNVCEIVGNNSGQGGLIILCDEQRERAISVFCDVNTSRMLMRRCTNAGTKDKERLPDVLCGLLMSKFYDYDKELFIWDVQNGKYQTSLILKGEDIIERPINLEDAVLLMKITGIPIYTYRSLMRMQSLPYSQDLSCLAIPINTLPDEKLKKALDEAVRSENYRQAKYINDELKRRKLSSSECSDESKS